MTLIANYVEKGYLPGYHESLPDQLSKDRYGSKLELIEGTDPHEIPKKDWMMTLSYGRQSRTSTSGCIFCFQGVPTQKKS